MGKETQDWKEVHAARMERMRVGELNAGPMWMAMAFTSACDALARWRASKSEKWSFGFLVEELRDECYAHHLEKAKDGRVWGSVIRQLELQKYVYKITLANGLPRYAPAKSSSGGVKQLWGIVHD